MRFLFAAYCIVNSENGDSLIGVYKRCLRIGMELHRRGHAVAIFCPGHGCFRDATVMRALGKLEFFDLPLRAIFNSSSKLRRRCLRKIVRGFAPDVVVIGEVPLGGHLMDAAVAASSLGIPSVVLDNAYSPFMAGKFVHDHAAFADGMALMGPSSFQMKDPPGFYRAIAPLISPCDAETAAALEKNWPPARRVVTVLGYEKKAEQLAVALLRAMPWLPCRILLITPGIAAAEARLAPLPPAVRERIQIMPMPIEEIFFEVLRRSSLVIGKAGFMQMCECICLQTPFLGLYYYGCYNVFQLPWRTLRFVGQTSGTTATLLVRLRFLRLLHARRRSMRALHSGGFNGLDTVCEFLESMAGKLRDGVTADSARAGYTRERVQQALEARHPGRGIQVLWVRSGPLRAGFNNPVDCVVAGYRSGRRQAVATLWGRRVTNPIAALAQAVSAADNDPARKIWYRSPDGAVVLEEDIGEDRLPGHFLFR
jgi:hypothetical protein